jgi:bifunctional non-homologous end joining protein LigD
MAFVKTSGASGIHICVPIKGLYDFVTCRRFAELVCLVVNKEMPQNTSLERSPAKRRGKIYLDYMQNRTGATLAAAYCVRPRSGATVSTPLLWHEVRPGLYPGMFHIKNMQGRLQKVGDLWQDFLSANGQELEKATQDILAALDFAP